MPRTCEQAVAEYFSSLRAMDVDRCVNTFAPNAESHDPVGEPPHIGHDAIRKFVAEMMSLFQVVALNEDHVFIVGNTAAVKWTGRAIGKNGQSVNFEGIDIIECNEAGEITSLRAYWSPAPLLAQLQS
jgi:steroid delta-isomerase